MKINGKIFTSEVRTLALKIGTEVSFNNLGSFLSFAIATIQHYNEHYPLNQSPPHETRNQPVPKKLPLLHWFFSIGFDWVLVYLFQ